MIKQPPNSFGTKIDVLTIQEALQSTIGAQLLALYAFDSETDGSSQPVMNGLNFLAVVEDEAVLHEIRPVLRPLLPPCPPAAIFSTSPSLSRHLKLNPTLAAHLASNGRPLSGQVLNIYPEPVTAAEAISFLTATALNASKALAPGLLPKQEATTAQDQLLQLANHLGLEPVPAGEDSSPAATIQTIAAIQGKLANILSNNPDLRWQTPAPTGAPPLVDALVAIYEHLDNAIFILPDWPAEEIEAYINNVDWTAVSESLSGQYRGLQLSTPSQFRLLIQHNAPADFFFQNYTHAWGTNALAAIEVPPSHIYQDLARTASQMEIQDFPWAYLTAEDSQLNRLIHDYQNNLLNIQLREELLHRLTGQPRVSPPIPLPAREAPDEQKVDATLNQFRWWANTYTEKMDNA